MTVPGKGGRPRKWLTDTDRVRAYRARQRGNAEPATVEVAAAGDDALAAVVLRQQDLEALLAESRRGAASLRRDLTATELANENLEVRINELEGERATLLSEIAELDDRLRHHPAPADTAQHDSAPLSNRAARRRASRRRHR